MTTDMNTPTIGKIWSFLNAEERRGAMFLLFLMFMGMILEIIGVGMVIPAVALMTQDNPTANYPMLQPLLHALGNPDQKTLIVFGMLNLVIIYVAKTAFLAFLAWQQARFTYGVQAHLSQRLFQTYLSQPYTFHLQRNSALLIHNTVNEVSQFANRAITPMLQIFTEGLVVTGITILMLAVEPLGALIVACVLGSAAFGFHYFTRARIAKWGEQRVYHEGLRLQHLQQGLAGAKEVILLGREKEFLDRFAEHNQKSAKIGQFQATTSQLPRLWLEMLAVVGLAVLVLSMIAQGNGTQNIMPILGLFAAAAFRLMPSLYRMLAALQSLRFVESIIEILRGELALKTLEQKAARPVGERIDFTRDIRLIDVNFTYPNSARPSLSSLSMCIRHGETVGFIGSSGAGKSTLVDIILGLLSPQGGQIEVDGWDISRGLRDWQGHIGYVPQTIYLTDDTLRRNVAFGFSNEAIDDEAVKRAVRAAQLDDFVMTLPQGLETEVGERGVRLSGGQRQRIGLARALYSDPSVLVLDEATSALDDATEAEVMHAITALHGRKTILIVAHRLSTVENCDRIIRMEGGMVSAEGTAAKILREEQLTT